MRSYRCHLPFPFLSQRCGMQLLMLHSVLIGVADVFSSGSGALMGKKGLSAIALPTARHPISGLPFHLLAMLDLGMLFYGGLLVLSIWRGLCSYWCCGVWLSIFNYMSLLYAMLAGALIFLLIGFYEAPLSDGLSSRFCGSRRSHHRISWFRCFAHLSCDVPRFFTSVFGNLHLRAAKFCTGVPCLNIERRAFHARVV